MFRTFKLLIGASWSLGEKIHIQCKCCSIIKLCPTLCHPMNYSMLGFHIPSVSPKVCTNSCPLNQWCQPIISSFVIVFSFCLNLPASGSFPVHQLFTSGDATSRSIFPKSVLGWFLSRLTDFICLLSKELWSVISIWKYQFFDALPSLLSSSHICTRLLNRPKPWTWNVRSMNQGKFDMVKQEMGRVNINILRISELKRTGIGEFK